MARTFAAVMRRAGALIKPSKLRKESWRFQKALTGLMFKSALAPLNALKSKTTKEMKKTPPKPDRRLGVVLQQLKASQVHQPKVPLRQVKPKFKKSDGTAFVKNQAQFLTRTHSAAFGSRSYKIYIPASQPKNPKGLILMLHGCNQNPDDFALGTKMNSLAEKHGLAIVYPAQTGDKNSASCWNWFKPSNQVRGSGEPAVLASLTLKLMKDYGLHRECVFVAGLSAGGAMALILADVYPDVFSAVGVHSGLARGAARNVLSAMSAMRSGGVVGELATPVTAADHFVRRIVFQGDADSTVHPANAALIVAAALGKDAAPTKITTGSVRGRSYTRSDFARSDGVVQLELWMLNGAQHAWSGGRASGSYTDTKGPDASAQMIRFFLLNSAKKTGQN